ncbi:MAG TPA: DUF5995 family protein [Streptosporangiaceae bacterium]|nr:DUF5995 family protein [Streptosporangiaceae bacterium]
MSAGLPTSYPPVTTVAGAVARMAAIEASLPPSDGLCCFNRMYLDVTREVGARITAGFFADLAFMTHLDVTFAGLYFDAVDAAADPRTVPVAWRPLVERRAQPGIEPVQFALAGMNAHINHDLPVAMVQTCTALDTSPAAGTHLADYQKVDRLLDAAEQSIRRSFESLPERAADQHLSAVCNLIACWTINSARDLAWDNCLLLWEVRDNPVAYKLACDGLAETAALASRMLLAAV